MKQESFSLDRAFVKLKSGQGPSSLQNKIEALKLLLTNLIDNDPKTLLKMYENDQVFSLIVNHFLEIHLPSIPFEGSLLPHTDNFKCLDVSLDFLEFLLSSLPESIVDKIEDLLRWLLKLRASNRGGDGILNKTLDLMSLA